jgi:Uri superfamily endonuclease
MELPEAKGTYVLITYAAQMRRLEVGRLGTFDIIPGYYVYVGSAFGAGGLRARVGHHLEATAHPHWHIDYLLRCVTPVEAWHSTDPRRLERCWVELFKSASQFRVPIARFGSSDYQRSRTSHLFYAKRRPTFRWFEQQLAERLECARIEQYVVKQGTTTAVCQ